MWSNPILGISGEVFWMKETFKLVKWVRQIALFNRACPHSITGRPV